MGLRLTIELVPESAFYKNLRSEISPKEWDLLRRASYRKAGYCCEICGEISPKHSHPVECHEIWEYDDKKHIQRLVGVQAICPPCHACKHYGLSQLRGIEETCIRHMMKVNSMKRGAVLEMVAAAFDKWQDRSEYEWKLDITWLDHARKHFKQEVVCKSN